MKYLIRKKKPKCVHVFIGGDTLCRLYSTGGLSPSKYTLSTNDSNLPMCKMCADVIKLNQGDKPEKAIEAAPISVQKKELAQLFRQQTHTAHVNNGLYLHFC